MDNLSSNIDVTMDKGCLNIALELSRQNAPDLSNIPYDIKISKLTDLSIISDQNHSHSFSSDMSYGMSKDILLPSIHICTVYTCTGTNEIYFDLLPNSNILVCNGGDGFTSVTAISIHQDHIINLSNDININMKHIATKLKNDCWSKLTPAVALGVLILRKRHEEDFSKIMKTTQLEIEMNDGKQNFELTQMFQHARYLHLSSARHSVSNLQGLWADGPNAAWNGFFLFISYIYIYIVLSIYIYNSYERTRL